MYELRSHAHSSECTDWLMIQLCESAEARKTRPICGTYHTLLCLLGYETSIYPAPSIGVSIGAGWQLGLSSLLLLVGQPHFLGATSSFIVADKLQRHEASGRTPARFPRTQ